MEKSEEGRVQSQNDVSDRIDAPRRDGAFEEGRWWEPFLIRFEGLRNLNGHSGKLKMRAKRSIFCLYYVRVNFKLGNIKMYTLNVDLFKLFSMTVSK